MHIQWENKHLTEEKNILIILVTFLVVISMIATVVSAAYEKHELQGGYTIKANITSIIGKTTVLITIMTINTTMCTIRK